MGKLTLGTKKNNEITYPIQEKLVYVDKIIEVIKEVPVIQTIEKIVHVPQITEVIKEVEKIKEIPVEIIKEIKVIEEKIIEKPITVIKEIEKTVEKVILKVPVWIWSIVGVETLAIIILLMK